MFIFQKHQHRKMDNVTLGSLLVAYRENNNLSQTSLAKMLNVSISSISKWENNKNLPSDDTMEEIRVLLGLSYEELHNPALAFTRFSNVQPCQTNKNQPSKKNFTLKAVIITALITAVITAIITTGINVLLIRQDTNEQINCREITQRYYEDALYGEVLEKAYVCTGNISLNSSDPFFQLIYNNWLTDENVRQDVMVLKFSFYQNESDALAWAPTEQTVYMFR